MRIEPCVGITADCLSENKLAVWRSDSTSGLLPNVKSSAQNTVPDGPFGTLLGQLTSVCEIPAERSKALTNGLRVVSRITGKGPHKLIRIRNIFNLVQLVHCHINLAMHDVVRVAKMPESMSRSAFGAADPRVGERRDSATGSVFWPSFMRRFLRAGTERRNRSCFVQSNRENTGHFGNRISNDPFCIGEIWSSVPFNKFSFCMCCHPGVGLAATSRHQRAGFPSLYRLISVFSSLS
jgi:hypothetical protein